MNRSDHRSLHRVPALKVHQWLEDWDTVQWDETAFRRRPDNHFYLLTLPAAQLKALADVHRRSTEGGLPRSQDLGIQRRHMPSRSKEIREFIQYGYPWSDLSPAKRQTGKYEDLRKPGWLPTAIVVNILKADDDRRGRKVALGELVTIDEFNDQIVNIVLPGAFTGPEWRPTQLAPIEVIDGQHRLWAFAEDNLDGNFELPIVAFHGLDLSWQAYLFWTINIKPKRINASLAFDLYPLLRAQNWLERIEGHSIYRETRAQELTSALWAHPQSPWYQRINMLGEPGQNTVSQAAWIRALTSTYIKSSEGRGVSIGGLFGAPVGSDTEMLPWSGAQQAAFLIDCWQAIQQAVKETNVEWTESLREGQPVPLKGFEDIRLDPAFAGPYTLLNTDQGVRGILYITNDLCYVHANDLQLDGWQTEEASGADEEQAISSALESLQDNPVHNYIWSISQILARYDWRTSSFPGLTESEKSLKGVFRGSGGYRELRRQLLRHLESEGGEIGGVAHDVLTRLGY